jgi:transcriptional regulator with XRE-family HTH domain
VYVATHYLRAWREHRNLTLEQVAERITLRSQERRDAVDDLTAPRSMTHASLSRIERGRQPYNQPLLEILAAIYMTDVASLLIRDPSDPEGIWSLWDRIRQSDKQVALSVLEGFARRTGTDG